MDPEALFTLNGAVRRDPEVDAWFARGDPVRAMAQPWFEAVRACGDDVRELIHDGHPTACVDGAAFAYIDAFTAHANLGFFHGAALADSAGLLRGTGKRMRHVKLKWGEEMEEEAVRGLVAAAYGDIRRRLSL